MTINKRNIIGIYTSEDNLRSYGKNIFDMMDKFMSRFPLEYRELFDRNLTTLYFRKCSNFCDNRLDGLYDSEHNTIYYINSIALSHELFHVASYNPSTKKSAFERNLDSDQGLLEGMTEYFRMKAYDLSNPVFYDFEVFAVMMLEEIEDIFKYYFIPNHDKFIKLFSSKKDIYSLLSSLDIYHLIYNCSYDDSSNRKDVKEAIRQVINSLINIELSMISDKDELIQYRDKFMDLIESKNVKDVLDLFYPKYCGYADTLIRRRIIY